MRVILKRVRAWNSGIAATPARKSKGESKGACTATSSSPAIDCFLFVPHASARGENLINVDVLVETSDSRRLATDVTLILFKEQDITAKFLLPAPPSNPTFSSKENRENTRRW